MRKLPNERLDICRQGLCRFHYIATVCNINCSIATCVLDVCKHVCTSRMICIINDAQQPAGKASIPSLPTISLLRVFTEKDKMKEATDSCADWEHLRHTDSCLIFKSASLAMLVITQSVQYHFFCTSFGPHSPMYFCVSSRRCVVVTMRLVELHLAADADFNLTRPGIIITIRRPIFTWPFLQVFVRAWHNHSCHNVSEQFQDRYT